MEFQPDYRHFETLMRNERPARLPLYEHLINVGSMEQILGEQLVVPHDADARRRFFEQYCGFYRQMTYDTVSFEVCVNGILPDGGALLGERAGPIQSRRDFEAYPWDDLPRLFWQAATPQFEGLHAALPAGMKAVGGVGNGVFEISEDLVGFQQLCYMQVDDPELFTDLYRRIGALLADLWMTFLTRHAGDFVACRIGDDMGFKTGTLLAPQTLHDHVVPQYRKVIRIIRGAGKPFLFHSCGCIFDVMDAFVEAGINAKHSNEDAIAPLDTWIERYGDRIALVGGIDTDRLCRTSPDDIYEFVLEEAARFRRMARGYALGSGNSIPEYVPREGYLAMIRAAQELRRREAEEG